MPRKTKIEYQGRLVEGYEMPFTTEHEEWNVYRLEDGSAVRVRVLVTEIVRTRHKNADGQPLVIVKSAMLVDYRDKKKEGRKGDVRRNRRRK